tara:strand:+ start:723 stop:1037 length:315 start_codon:yes stop_codon:yes gene_type:complete
VVSDRRRRFGFSKQGGACAAILDRDTKDVGVQLGTGRYVVTAITNPHAQITHTTHTQRKKNIEWREYVSEQAFFQLYPRGNSLRYGSERERGQGEAVSSLVVWA